MPIIYNRRISLSGGKVKNSEFYLLYNKSLPILIGRDLFTKHKPIAFNIDQVRNWLKYKLTASQTPFDLFNDLRLLLLPIGNKRDGYPDIMPYVVPRNRGDQRISQQVI